MKLECLIDKAKQLKDNIDVSEDEEKKLYLRLALNSTYDEIRFLMREGAPKNI